MATQIKPVKYELVASNAAAVVIDRVNVLLTEGWVPHGTTTVTVAPTSGLVYAQAMVKLEIVNVNVPNEPVRGQSIITPQLH